ncbi:MAG: Ig-like domain-containing protein, partial [Limisphaerales bacterium]
MKSFILILNPPRRVILTVFWSLLAGFAFAGFAAAPTIESVPALTLDEDHPLLDVPIRIADADSPPESLTLLAFSSNAGVFPASGLIIQGTGAERRLSLHPAANSNGVAHVTLRVLDPSGLASTQIVPVTVLPVPDAPTIAPIPPQSVPPGTLRFPVGVIVHDPDTTPAEVKIR